MVISQNLLQRIAERRELISLLQGEKFFVDLGGYCDGFS